LYINLSQRSGPFVGVITLFGLTDNTGGSAALPRMFSGAGEVAQPAFGILLVKWRTRFVRVFLRTLFSKRPFA
jgi:hypothetical protein